MPNPQSPQKPPRKLASLDPAPVSAALMVSGPSVHMMELPHKVKRPLVLSGGCCKFGAKRSGVYIT